jgi:hypothetical protein
LTVKRQRLLALILACACGDIPASDGSAGATVTDSAADGAAGAISTEASDQAAVDSAFLSLEGEGLRAFLASTGSARPLPFGTPAADALRFLNAVLEATPVDEGLNADCAVEYATWENGLTAWFALGRFAGWSVGRGSPLTTVNGIGLGATRSQLEEAYDPVITRSSLGEEFAAGGLAGVLESAAPDARIQHLWSGQTCIAR